MLRLRVLLFILLIALSSNVDAFHQLKESNRVGSSTSLNVGRRFKNFDQVLDTFREEPVIVYFSSAKCGPCKLMEKELRSVREMVGDEMKIFSLDTEKWPSVGSRFKISRLPCLVVYKNSEQVLRMEGVNPAATVVEQVRGHL